MLTPQEVAEHAFQKASFGGYNMAMVDEFLDQVTADYTSLYKENATLKAKMKVLADKIEEYRSTEEAMRKAMLSAQRMADQMVAEAEEKVDTIIAEAEAQAREKITSIRQEVESEQLRLTAAQNATAAYIAKLKDLYQNQMEYLSSLSRLSAEPKKPDPVTSVADAIGSAVEKALEEELPAEEPTQRFAPPEEEEDLEPEEESEEGPTVYEELRGGAVRLLDDDEEDEDEEDEDDTSPTRRIDFDNLKFGKDYEIE